MDKHPKVTITIDARHMTCHRCLWEWDSVSALSHAAVVCPRCRTNVTVNPIRPTGARTQSPVGVFTGNEPPSGRIKSIKYSNIDPHTGESKLLVEQNFPVAVNDDEYTNRNNSRRSRSRKRNVAAVASKSK
jgi:hypothetical protein